MSKKRHTVVVSIYAHTNDSLCHLLSTSMCLERSSLFLIRRETWSSAQIFRLKERPQWKPPSAYNSSSHKNNFPRCQRCKPWQPATWIWFHTCTKAPGTKGSIVQFNYPDMVRAWQCKKSSKIVLRNSKIPWKNLLAFLQQDSSHTLINVGHSTSNYSIFLQLKKSSFPTNSDVSCHQLRSWKLLC